MCCSIIKYSPRSHTANAKGVNQADQKLEEENEEENHEVHWTVISKCLVARSEPAHVWGWREQERIDEGQPKSLSRIATSEEVQQAGQHVDQ